MKYRVEQQPCKSDPPTGNGRLTRNPTWTRHRYPASPAGALYRTQTVVLTTGTFLKAIMHTVNSRPRAAVPVSKALLTACLLHCAARYSNCDDSKPAPPLDSTDAPSTSAAAKKSTPVMISPNRSPPHRIHQSVAGPLLPHIHHT
jgi:hypothetical protein